MTDSLCLEEQEKTRTLVAPTVMCVPSRYEIRADCKFLCDNLPHMLEICKSYAYS